METPRGVKHKEYNGKNKVIKLKNTLYGIRKSTYAFWKYMNNKLEACVFDQ